MKPSNFKLSNFKKESSTFFDPTTDIPPSSPSKLSLARKIKKTLNYFAFKSKLQKIFKNLEFEQSRKTSSSLSTDLESLEIFDLFCGGMIATKSLETLNLSSTNLPDFNMIKLSQCIVKNKSLKFLDLSNNSISSLGFKYLFRMLKENNSLESLSLFNNEIQKESIHDINSLILKNKNIIEMNLNFCGMDTLSVRSFLEALSVSSHFKKVY